MPARLRFRAISTAATTVAAVVTGLLVSAVPAQLAAQLRTPYGSIYYFGDSFTDTGNAVKLADSLKLPNPTPSPLYFPGRFSNGPVFSELLAARFGLAANAQPAIVSTGNNYAIGGATTGLLGANGTPSGILSQVGRFSTDHPPGTPGTLGPNPLFVIFGGSNDIIGAAALATPQLRAAAIQQSVQNLTGVIGSLATNYGARNFLIPLIPDVGAAPLFANSPNAAIATDLTNTFNQLLGNGINGLNALLGLQAATLNLNNLLFNIRADAASGGSRYGITNTTVPCFTPPPVGPIPCSNALFVDQLHPTTQVQALIADAAYNRLVLGEDITAVPEPASVVLVAAGLVVTGVVARRRARIRG